MEMLKVDTLVELVKLNIPAQLNGIDLTEEAAQELIKMIRCNNLKAEGIKKGDIRMNEKSKNEDIKDYFVNIAWVINSCIKKEILTETINLIYLKNAEVPQICGEDDAHFDKIRYQSIHIEALLRLNTYLNSWENKAKFGELIYRLIKTQES